MSVQTVAFLQDWLVNHICNTDKQYSACFKEHGLS